MSDAAEVLSAIFESLEVVPGGSELVHNMFEWQVNASISRLVYQIPSLQASQTTIYRIRLKGADRPSSCMCVPLRTSQKTPYGGSDAIYRSFAKIQRVLSSNATHCCTLPNLRLCFRNLDAFVQSFGISRWQSGKMVHTSMPIHRGLSLLKNNRNCCR